MIHYPSRDIIHLPETEATHCQPRESCLAVTFGKQGRISSSGKRRQATVEIKLVLARMAISKSALDESFKHQIPIKRLCQTITVSIIGQLHERRSIGNDERTPDLQCDKSRTVDRDLHQHGHWSKPFGTLFSREIAEAYNSMVIHRMIEILSISSGKSPKILVNL
jgi:hypothetical protein